MSGALDEAWSGAPDPWVGALFGDDVRTGSLAIEAADPARLAPAEAALAARFAPPRARAFAAGRLCARPLLAALGADPAPLLVGPHRAPVWPPGVVGSISHGAGLCVVAAARRGALRGLGVDVESDAPLAAALRRRVCSAGEARLLAGADDAEAGRVAKLLFSAKEAVYKCVHPLLQRPLGFLAVEIRLAPDAGADTGSGRFHARALEPAGPGADALLADLEGAWSFRAGRVLTGATLRARATAA